MNFKYIMLSEIIQTQMAIHYKFHFHDIIEKTKPQYQISNQWLLWTRGEERELLIKGQEGTFGDDRNILHLYHGCMCLSKFIEL